MRPGKEEALTRKASLLNTHADIARVLENIPKRTVRLNKEDQEAFELIQLRLMEINILLEEMWQKKF